MRKMRMFQRDAYISLDFITGASEVFRLLPPDDENINQFISFGEIGVGKKKKVVVYEQPMQMELNALQHELQLFVNSIINDERPVVNGEDGLRALKVAETIIKKINETKIK
jgi:predicted dehydrogenase